ncbi:MAG: right-handed parallel beta-helix repeat-containing protein, partial [Phycisphaerales bacterium]
MSKTTYSVHFASLLSIAAIVASDTAALADEIHVPDDWPMIQMAIGVASDGDVIIVQPGEYPEQINLLGKAITVRSTDPTNPDVVSATRITGPTAIPTVLCKNGEGVDTVLSGFSITHLSPLASDTGMEISDASPTVTYCVFYENVGTYGGGMRILGSSAATISHCTFTRNEATENGGGMRIGGWSSASITDCIFLDNSSVGRGGAIENNSNTISTFSGCVFQENDTQISGGAIFNWVNAELIGCTFLMNSALLGGAVYNAGQGDPAGTVQDCLFDENTAQHQGGALYNSSVTLTVVGCDFAGNTCGDVGGAMLNQNSDLTLDDCTFAGNYDNPLVDSIGSYNWTLDAPTPTPTGACCLGADCMVGT